MQTVQFRFVHPKEKFPVKLYTILELAEVRGLGCFGCSWLHNGRAFKIYDEREFMKASVPMFFKQTRIRSFHRQLQLWGFKRLPKSVDSGAWHNKFFVRGAPKEIEKMVRIKIKGKAKQDYPKAQEEGNLHSMLPLSSASKTLGLLPQTLVDPRRISMDLKMVSVGLDPAKQVPLNCDRPSSPRVVDLSPPEATIVRYVSSSSLTSSAPSLKHEEQYPMMNAVWPLEVAHPAGPSAIISEIDEAKFRLTAGLEPLPWKHEQALPTEAAPKRRMLSGIEPLLIDNGPPMDEFANYIDVTIKELL